jgi:heterotetrameric sarcosine oxidase gamma subunit
MSSFAIPFSMIRMEGASVADFAWVPRSPLEHVLVAGPHGALDADPGVTLLEQRNFDLIQVMARRGRWAEMANAANARFGVTPPEKPSTVRAKEAMLVWSGPDQFLVLSKGGTNTLEMLEPPFAGVASLSDQSHARALIRISGPSARAMLAKLSSIDLHPSAFPPGAAAATSMDHTSVTLWRGDDSEGQAVFDLLVFATFAQSLWHTILDAGAEFGIDIRQPVDLA